MNGKSHQTLSKLSRCLVAKLYQISEDTGWNQKNRQELKGTFGKQWEFLNTIGNAKFIINIQLILWRNKTLLKINLLFL
jgi:hypothetical protein